MDMQNAKREYYNPTTTRKGAGAGGIASVTATQGGSNLLEATATFKKSFGKHKLDVLAGYTYQDFLFEDLSAKATNFLPTILDITISVLGKSARLWVLPNQRMC